MIVSWCSRSIRLLNGTLFLKMQVLNRPYTMTSSNRVLIVSNRLPLKISHGHDKMEYKTSEGGLATGLGSIYKEGNNLWIGWPGAEIADEDQAEVAEHLEEHNLLPIFLNKDEINNFYEGFSNETLWPLFHYFPSYATYNPEYWEYYKSVNQKYADAIIRIATKDDTIWIHDYQLMCLPALIREAIPDISIGFFLHIPFPSYEVFRLLPWRRELLMGVLGADLIGFHTYDDVRHFCSAANRITGIPLIANELRVNHRMVVADAFPISIDYKKYEELANDATTRRNERKLKQLIHNNKLIISIDRLDYSKGIIHRLRAYELFLDNHPELRGKVSMIQLVVPSRDTVPQYKELKEDMNKMISEINGRFSTLGWQPIQHYYRSFPIHLLSALYKAADVALVTPMRDGMNLVAKEYVASKPDGKGVLILSEMAGASRELSDAIMVNPNDIWDFADKIYQALYMPEDEQKRRMASMQQIVSKFDIHTWVKNFRDRLDEIKIHQQSLSSRLINMTLRQKISTSYVHAQKRLILLDYDGTLVPFQKQVMAAVPDADLLALLGALCEDPHNKVVITSGRDYQTLFQWLGALKLDMIAEHGAWYRDYGGPWKHRKDLSTDWKSEILNVMSVYARRTPGASIEEKSYSLAWHYRKVEDGLGMLRANELITDVRHFIADRGLQILQGDKVIEVKSMAVNKGRAARRWLEKDTYDFIMAIGDDHTDEDTFKEMPDDAITIKVGSNLTAANYYVNGYLDVRSLLQELVAAPTLLGNNDSVQQAG